MTADMSALSDLIVPPAWEHRPDAWRAHVAACIDCQRSYGVLLPTARTIDADALLEWLDAREAEMTKWKDWSVNGLDDVRDHIISLCPDQPEGP